jgi:hypothetical protein
LGYVYTIHCPEDEAELAAAEAWAFTGSEPEDRLAYAAAAVDIARAAYLRQCVHLEASGGSLEELVGNCLAQQVAYERVQAAVPAPAAEGPRAQGRGDPGGGQCHHGAA